MAGRFTRKTILLIITLDTKGEEASYLKQAIEKQGLNVLVMDVGIFPSRAMEGDIKKEEVAVSGGQDIETLLQAKEQAQLLVASDEITRQADEQAEQILARAQQEATEVRRQCDDYAKRLFANLEDYTARVLGHIRSSRERLEGDVAPSTAQKQR